MLDEPRSISIARMTGATRKWWWLVGGCLMMAVGIGLMSPLGTGLGCSAGGFGSDVASAEASAQAAANACVESLNAAERNWWIGAALLLVGLATVAYDIGHRRGRRAGHKDVSTAVTT